MIFSNKYDSKLLYSSKSKSDARAGVMSENLGAIGNIFDGTSFDFNSVKIWRGQMPP